MARTAFFVSVCTVALSFAAAVQAADRLVPGQYATLQSAIDAASDGDVVVLAPGTYVGPFSVQAKPITIRGASADSTVLTVNGAGCVLSVSGVVSPSLKLEGLTIQGGRTSDNGAGLRILSSLVTISDCKIRDNIAHRDVGCAWCNPVDIYGGGIYAIGGSDVRLERCIVSENRVSESFYAWGAGGSARGGGIFASGAAIRLVSCEVRDNTARGNDYPPPANGNGITAHGAGVEIRGGSALEVTDCVISGNRIFGDTCRGASGAAIGVHDSTATILRTVLRGNLATATAGPSEGAGIRAEGASHVSIADSYLWLNFAGGAETAGAGSAIFSTDAVVTIAGTDICGSGANPISGQWIDGGGTQFCRDRDADGTPDMQDDCPLDPNKTRPGSCGCGIADVDSDADGTLDCDDGCPLDPGKINSGQCGCGHPDADTDGDGVLDCNDGCPNDPNKLAPGTCGCGVADTDSDSDGTPNCNDLCPNDPAKLAPGTCGCGIADTDSDSDGVANCNDGCPTDPAKSSPGTCGCGVADTDSDSDGTPNCNDGCPNDPAKLAPGTCGCGVADTDSDSDGTPNCVDTCPNDPTNQCDLVFEVPTEYPTIQAAIDAAPADRASVVLVAAGTFNEGFDLRSKDIVVRGQLNGLTILRGVGLTTSIAKFSGGEPATAGVENLVFRDGTVGSRITPTTAYTVGGAIYGTNSFAFIRHCRFEGCRADYGGAVYLLYGGVTIDGCEFVGNIANIEGGGVQCFSCTGMVRGSVFNLNRCGMNGPGSGSALKFVGANATGDAIFVDDCSFTGNIAGVSGSAIEFYENVQGYPGVLHISRTNCANNVSGSPAQTGAAGLRVLGRMESCILSEGSIFCANLPRNVSGPYFDDGTAGVCDCAADFNADGNVNASDLSLLLSVWGATLASGVGDVTHNGTVDAGDLSILLSLWGACDSN